jgi:hypothetical protein
MNVEKHKLDNSRKDSVIISKDTLAEMKCVLNNLTLINQVRAPALLRRNPEIAEQAESLRVKRFHVLSVDSRVVD